MCTLWDVISAVMRLTLGVILLSAGIFKIRQGVSQELLHYLFRNLPGSLRSRLAHGVPIVELAVGIWLLSGTGANIAIAIAACIFAGFTIGIYVLVKRGYASKCACFGVVDRYNIGLVHLYRNTLLLVGCIFASVQSYNSYCFNVLPWQLPVSVLGGTALAIILSCLVYIIAAEIEVFLRQTRALSISSRKG